MLKLSIFTTILLLSSWVICAQDNPCNLTQSRYSSLYTVVPDDIRCIAQHSDQDITIFFSFAAWCKPCRKHLPDAVQVSKTHHTDFYLLLMDRENQDYKVGARLIAPPRLYFFITLYTLSS
jgi:hypothetical protein